MPVGGEGGQLLLGAEALAVAFGLRTLITSSSDEKLKRAKQLGAWQGINYRTHPDWDEVAREITGGRGVDHVLELVGGDNLARSVNALAPEGRLSLIGLLGATQSMLPTLPFMRKHLRLFGVAVGHRRAFERMNAAIEHIGIKPVIDSVYGFEDAHQAFKRLDEGAFGKIVIDCR